MITPFVARKTRSAARAFQAATLIGIAAVALDFAPSASAQITPPEAAKTSNWKLSSSLAIKETFDSNVYLQSQTDRANQSSWVTSLTPQAALAWNPSPLLLASLSYAPEITFFHSEPAEDFVAHRVLLGLCGKFDKTAYESTTSLVFIDGSSVAPTWTGQGGAPATGGPAVRDRRDAAVYRENFRVTQNFGKWFVRPAFSFYLHDFQTDERSTKNYQNFVDRQELLAGADLGRKLNDQVSLWTGYRYGIQDQAKLLSFPERYDSTFSRVLFGVDGQLTKWLKASLALGPEFRRFGDRVSDKFENRDVVNLFVDSSVTLTPFRADTIIFSVKQFEQPGFGGRSVCEDLTYDVNWKHKLGNRWTAGLGGRAYNTYFLKPTKRNDWVLSASAFVNFAITSQLNAEVSYVFEDGLTQTPDSAGREYERHLFALGLKYVSN